ncbi:MAG: hypothetical protein QXP01_09655 [Candidatus Hadarchaeum sp.]
MIFSFLQKRFGKIWVAKVTGSDPKYQYRRVFEQPVRYRDGYVEYLVGEGLYQVHDGHDREWRLIFKGSDGLPKCKAIDERRAVEIVKLLDAGVAFDEAVQRTRPTATTTTTV